MIGFWFESQFNYVMSLAQSDPFLHRCCCWERFGDSRILPRANLLNLGYCEVNIPIPVTP
jgi:hypothetical protein